MQSNRFLNGLRRAYARYDRLMEKQGFYIVLGVCVLVIVLSAVYTFYLRDEWEETTPSSEEELALAAGGYQQTQTLSEALIESQGAKQATAEPTASPLQFIQPVSGFTDRDFSITEPQFFSHTNVWQVHPGLDLQTDYGTPVKSCAAGTVVRVWEDNELGLCVRISHSLGYETIYAGLSSASYVQSGDPVSQGQTVGHVGNGVLAEEDAQPHLHFEVWKDGRPIDPLEVFLGVDK